MGQYTAWEVIVIAILVAVVLLAGKTPAFLRKRQKPRSGAEPGSKTESLGGPKS
jgi:hypothetical protein